MSILKPIARLILGEHKRRPIEGHVVTIGRQTIHLTPSEASAEFARAGIEPKPVEIILDENTIAGRNNGFISDWTFFGMLGIKGPASIDVSAYEGSNLVHDMNYPLDHSWGFDFVFDGSTLDNLFDPACGLRNMSKLCKPGGRVMGFNSSANFNKPYLMFTPAWFWDFFEANGYENIQAWTGAFAGIEDPWIVSRWTPAAPKAVPARDFNWFTIFCADKTERSTSFKTPVQAHYRRLHEARR